jgi:hypothetical protein
MTREQIDYIPYGEEWEKEMMQFRKLELIAQLRKAHLERGRLAEALQEVVRISDRDHVAWHKAKEALSNKNLLP